MKSFRWVVREIRWTIAQILIIPSLLKGIIFFLILYLLLSILDLVAVWSVVPALLYTTMIIGKEIGINKLKLVERYYPNLREKLRTAADYADKDDVMVNELHKEVIEEVRKVAASTFFSRKDLFFKIITCILLSFAIVSVTHFNISAAAYKDRIGDALDGLAATVLLNGGEENVLLLNDSNGTLGAGSGVSKDLFGKSHLATLGDEELEVELKPKSLELAIGEVKDPEKRDFEDVFPDDVYLEQSRTYEETIPKDQQDLVKAYFKGITKT